MLLFSEATHVLMANPLEGEDLVFVSDEEIRGRQATIRLFSLESISDPLPEAAQVPLLEPVTAADDEVPETVPGVAF
jgi:hypothetical protein